MIYRIPPYSGTIFTIICLSRILVYCSLLNGFTSSFEKCPCLCFFIFDRGMLLWYRQNHKSLRWRYNDHAGVSNHQSRDCLLNRLFRRRSKKTLKLRVTGLCVGNSPRPVNSPHKGPVTRRMFPFDDVIMLKSEFNSYDIGDTQIIYPRFMIQSCVSYCAM